MSRRWFDAYEAATARGARMRVHTHGCSCQNCRLGCEALLSSSGIDLRISTPGAGVTALAPGVLPAGDEDQGDEFDGEAWDLARDHDTDTRNGVL